MEITQGIDWHGVEALLAAAGESRAYSERAEAVSGALLGLPYKENPLAGGPCQEEIFTADIASFDCVTFCETVLAISLSRQAQDFPALLREIRYASGAVSWRERNHYTSQWFKQNERKGFLQRLSFPNQQTITRELSLLEGYPSVRAEIAYCPLTELQELVGSSRTGDMLAFVSLRENLDVFHIGIAVQRGHLYLRHAAKSHGSVVEELLSDFLGRNEMLGIISARPMLSRP